MENTKKINYTFKVLYAIGIVIIVSGHCGNGGISLFYEFFPPYSFALAIFLFSSGYFYKSEYENNIKNFLTKKFKKLIIPMYLWNFFYAILLLFLQKFDFFPNVKVNLHSLFITPLMNGHQFLLNLGSWFIFPLFFTHFLNIILRILLKQILKIFKLKLNEILYFFICLAIGMFGVFLEYSGYAKGLCAVMVKVFYFMPFYGFGILYKKYEKYDDLNNLAYFSIILLASLFSMYHNRIILVFLPSLPKFYTNIAMLPYVNGFLGTLFWLRIAKIFTPCFGKNKKINFIADNTYSIMVNHYLGFFMINALFLFLNKCFNLCSGFDLYRYKTDIYYFYLPHWNYQTNNYISQMNIIYLIAGITIPLLIQYIVRILYKKSKISNIFNKKETKNENFIS